jgi:hypothetical protein
VEPIGEAHALLEKAADAGLKVGADGGKLIVRGPRSAENLARAILDRKGEIMPLVGGPCSYFWGKRSQGRCVRCGHGYGEHVEAL